ncbi:GPI-anchor transamidase component PIGT-like [Saccoglossus kowalevskii]|uniref:GPI transamidase component PIG-T-like n=1 Tax=Saccoglossus kowalevskii TaxID=10224 RepID=A0ABM0GS46_SACKO|nr:PREDICTED: GPI transamidase component PIG-T-like [Saccoglossus kowalevskii]
MAEQVNVRVCLVIICLVLMAPEGLSNPDKFDEELFIRPLPSGHVYSHFQFTTTWDVDVHDPSTFAHYNFFPKSLGQIINKYSVQELHLSLTQGYWRHEKWGYPVSSAPPGAQLWVWFQESTVDIEQTWKELVNVLSGLFCASLNFIDGTVTVKPQLSFRPQGIATDKYSINSTYLRYATLPRENVCTENLTPWKKLLPCDSKAGLSTLLNAMQLYNANYHSLEVHVRPVCANPSCTIPALELSQSLSVVFDQPIREYGKQDWSLKKLFGRGARGACPMASTSNIYVDISSNKTSNLVQLTPEPTDTRVVTRGGGTSTYGVYDLNNWDSSNQLMLAMKWKNKHCYDVNHPPQIHVHRFITGYGQDKGGITCLLFNHDTEKSQSVIYLDTVPWYIRLYLHTLKITTNNKPIKPDWMKYIPGQDRTRGYMLEMVLTLPPDSVTTIGIDFDRAFLKWTEHPPDANIGFHISSAVVSTILQHGNNTFSGQTDSRLFPSLFGSSNQKDFFIRLYSEILLIQLPTPDFSMPYNVICLACTVVAIAFGSLHNLTTRSFAPVDPNKKPTGIKAKIISVIKKIKGHKPDETDKSKNTDEKVDNKCETTEEVKKDR